MKKLLKTSRIINILIFTLLFISVSYIFPAGKPKIAITPVLGTVLTKSERLVLTEVLQSEIVKKGYYDVIESKRINEVLKAKKNRLKDIYSNKGAAKLGNLLSADKIVLSMVGRIGRTNLLLTVKIVDVNTGKIDSSESVRMRDKNELVNSIKTIINRLFKRLVVVGRIIRKRDDFYYINIGMKDGIQKGDVIIVERLIEILKDDKGREIFKRSKRIASLTVVEVQQSGSSCLLKKEFDKKDYIKKNDKVLFFPEEQTINNTKSISDLTTPLIEVAFVLDTTGSMSGLINGAKRKIWSIANSILRGNPQPNLRVAVIGFRDIGDQYVTKEFPFRENIDEAQQDLLKLHASGGGDLPEHVLKALYNAIFNLKWSKRNSLKMIFLVGDAPPHCDYKDGYSLKNIIKSAAKKRIIINTIRCGRRLDTKTAWLKFSENTNGEFITLAQSGGMVHRRSKYDSELSKLNDELGRTFVVFGRKRYRAKAKRRIAAQRKLKKSDKAGAAIYNSRRRGLDAQDLISKLEEKKIKLGSIKKEHLPAKMQRMNKDERKKYLAGIGRKRRKIKARIDRLSKEREKELAKKEKSGRSSFDDEVYNVVKKQAKKINVAY